MANTFGLQVPPSCTVCTRWQDYAPADCFGAAYATRHALEVIMDHYIPLTILTDSESLFKIIVKSTVTSEKRLMIDIKAITGAYDRNESTSTG